MHFIWVTIKRCNFVAETGERFLSFFGVEVFEEFLLVDEEFGSLDD